MLSEVETARNLNLQLHYSPEILEKHVRFLSGVNPARNYTNPEILDEVAEYIAKEFQNAGAKVQFQEFNVPQNWEATYKNVRALFGEEKEEKIVIGAHYDVCGKTPGADDNASAVAGLIALAYMLGKTALHTPVECVAFVLEEPPFFASQYMGSFQHARLLRDRDIQLRGMICLEMIGYFTDKKDSQEYPIPGLKLLYPSRGNFISVVGRFSDSKLVKSVSKAMKNATDLPVEHLAAPSFVPGIDLSDHRSYWENGYQAVMITDTALLRNHNYHQTTDTPETLDYVSMFKVVKGVYTAILELSG